MKVPIKWALFIQLENNQLPNAYWVPNFEIVVYKWYNI